MEEKQKLKSFRGITLIALVVTIIVLMILAGVSISLVLGENGIITKVKFAKQETLNAQVEEREYLNEVVDYLENNGEGNEDLEITINDLKAGDYIKYNTGIEGVGEIMCRVLYEANSEYGLQIISDKNVEKVVLGGSDWETAKASYNTAIKTLNDKAEKYINKNYVIDARCVGSLPTIDSDGNFIQKDSETKTTVSIPSDWDLPKGWTTTNTGCYDKDTNYKTDQAAMQSANLLATGESYWVASRSAYIFSSEYKFQVRLSSSTGDWSPSNYLCVVKSFGAAYATMSGPWMSYMGIRPCFSVKSDVRITGRGGKTADTAYTIKL